jgi:hypothetical protein
MNYENVVLFGDMVAWAMARAPKFKPEDGRDQPYVFSELRTRLVDMKNEWWGGDGLYMQMADYIDKAEIALNAEQTMEAKLALGEIDAILGQTPRPKKTPKAT